MELRFFGVKQDDINEKWRFKYHKRKNKNPSFTKPLFDTQLQAAFVRDKQIRVENMYDKNERGNQRNFSDEEYQKLLKIQRTPKPGKTISLGNNLHLKNKEVEKIIERFVVTQERKLVPTEKDIVLADKALVDIRNIYIKHYQEAYLSVANYIAEIFFDNNPELIQKKKPAVGKRMSFNQLCAKLKDEDSGAPSKSWMYNALGLLADNFLIEKEGTKLFHTYGKMSVSHRIKLLSVKDMGQKKKLIKEAEKKALPVRAFQTQIDKVLGKAKPKRTYLTELKGIKSDLKKRLIAIKKLPDAEKEKATLQDIEIALESMIEEVGGYILEQKN